jgi:hypothetical protein
VRACRRGTTSGASRRSGSANTTSRTEGVDHSEVRPPTGGGTA